MDFEQARVLLILAAAVALFVSEWLSVDLVAVILMATLIVSGAVTPEQGISGFAHPATIVIAAMFVLSGGLRRTGVLQVIGRQIVRWSGRSEASTVLTLMLVVGIASAFVNNTAAVAAALPMAIQIGRERGIPVSRLLIPISFAAIFGGTCTLIGTSTNLVVSEVARTETLGGPLTMFEFSLLGLVMLAAGILYMVTFGRALLPHREGDGERDADSRPRHFLTEVVVETGSTLVGRHLGEARLDRRQIEVLEVRREGIPFEEQPEGIELAEGDVLLIWGPVDQILGLEASYGLAVLAQRKLGQHPFGHREAALVEGIVAPDSVLEGKTIKEINFRGRFGATALAMRRHGEPLRMKVGRVKLRFGDALLIHGPREAIEALQDTPDFLIFEELQPPALRRRRWPIAIAALAGIVLLSTLRIPGISLFPVPVHVAAILGVLLLIGGRVLSLREAYDEIDMRVVFLIAGLIPLGHAMADSGAAELLAGGLISLCEPLGPVAILSAFYLVTSVLTAAMSNTAAGLLMAELSVKAAAQVGVDSRPFLITVCFAASASFITPIGYQTNTMVYGTGGYRFFDFTRVGLPLQLLFWGLATWLIPLIWPLVPTR